MSEYEYLQIQRNYCELMARVYADDGRLKTFYINAANGYKIKQDRLTLAEAANE